MLLSVIRLHGLRSIHPVLVLWEVCCSYVATTSVVCYLARSPEVSGVVYVPGNMAASFRGRPIRSLRMRGKPEKLESVISIMAL